MNDIITTPIPVEPTRLQDEDRFFETQNKQSDSTSYRFNEIIHCKLYDTTTQTPSTWTYTFPNMTQEGWFSYVSGVLTIPKTTFYYCSTWTNIVFAYSIGGWFILNTGVLLCDVYSSTYLWTGLERRDTNSNILQLTKGQTITITYTQNSASTMKSELYLIEINPLSVTLN